MLFRYFNSFRGYAGSGGTFGSSMEYREGKFESLRDERKRERERDRETAGERRKICSGRDRKGLIEKEGK